MTRVLLFALLSAASLPVLADSAACLGRLEADDADGALTACSAAVQADPEDARSWAIRGMAHLAKNRPAESASDADRALGIDPRLSLALLLRAQLREKAGDIQGARADLATALEQDKKNVDALTGLAELEARAGNTKQALELFERAAKAEPDNPHAWVRSANLVADKDRRAALKYADRAIKASKDDAQLYLLRGRIRGADEDHKAAAADFRKASELAPDDADIAVEWARALLSQGRPGDAIEVLDASIRRQPAAVALVERARHRHQAGNPIGAHADVLAAVALDPKLDASTAVAQINEAVESKYAPGLKDVENTLGLGLAVPERSCEASAGDDMMEALIRREGDRARAEADLRDQAAARYAACQDQRLPAPTERFAQARQTIRETTAAVERQGEALIRDCAAHPALTATCVQNRDAFAERAGKLMSGLRALEEAASKRRQEVASAKAGAADLAAAAVRRARDAFEPTAARRFVPVADLEELRKTIEVVSGASVPNIARICVDPGVPSIHASDSTVEAYNQRSKEYFDCLARERSDAGEVRDRLSDAVDALRETRAATDALMFYRCSQKSFEGCIPHEQWQAVSQLVPKTLVQSASATLQRFDQLIETTIPEARERHNNDIGARNAQLDAHENSVRRQQTLEAFADAFSEALDSTPQYRRDSSTSAPGVY